MCNEAKTFENPDFLLKITVFENITRPFSDSNLHFQKDWHFFSEGVRTSDFFKKKIESGKFMGKLTDFENIVSARRKSRWWIFPYEICGPPGTHLSKTRELVTTFESFWSISDFWLRPAANLQNSTTLTFPCMSAGNEHWRRWVSFQNSGLISSTVVGAGNVFQLGESCPNMLRVLRNFLIRVPNVIFVSIGIFVSNHAPRHGALLNKELLGARTSNVMSCEVFPEVTFVLVEICPLLHSQTI